MDSNPTPRPTQVGRSLLKTERVGSPHAEPLSAAHASGVAVKIGFAKAKHRFRLESPHGDPRRWVSFLRFFGEKSERVGFEPTIRFHVYTLSKRAP